MDRSLRILLRFYGEYPSPKWYQDKCRIYSDEVSMADWLVIQGGMKTFYIKEVEL